MTSPFLEKLPLEIRLEVYRYLVLVGPYTKLDHAMKSKEYNENRSVIFGPDHSYQFHGSILRVNRQIRREALDILQSETMLISLQMPISIRMPNLPWYSEDMAREMMTAVMMRAETTREEGMREEFMREEFKRCGVVNIDRKILAHSRLPFAKIAMVDRSVPIERSTYFVFAADDLPTACVYLQRKIQESNNRSGDVYIRVETCPPVVETACPFQDGVSSILDTKLRRYLEPLEQIRGASQVDIDGHPGHDAVALIASMTDRRRSAREIMDLVAAHFDRGDQYLLDGASEWAITEYKAACRAMERGVFDDMEVNDELFGGRFDGLRAGLARDNARVQLHTKIASTYLELGQARMARIYVERICVPLTVKDDKGYRVKGELNLPQPEEENTVVYAELMFVAAQISLAAGNEENALLELYEALCREGDREDLSKLVDHYRTRKRRPARIFRRFYEEQRQYRRKCEAAVPVASNRIVKADKILAQDPRKARQLYAAAYQKIKCYKGDWNVEALIAESLTKLTRSLMEHQEDEVALRWVDTILALPFRPDRLYLGWPDLDWPISPPLHYSWTTELCYVQEASYTAHYIKAVMLDRRGKISAAVRHFEAALRWDSGCHATYYQLENLKQEKAEREGAKGADRIVWIWETRWPEWEKVD